VDPELLNPAWYVGDLDGAGTSTIAQNITIRRINSDQSVDLDGQYTVDAVSPTEVTLCSRPRGVTTDWNNRLVGYLGGQTRPLSASVPVGKRCGSGPSSSRTRTRPSWWPTCWRSAVYSPTTARLQCAASTSFEVEATPVISVGRADRSGPDFRQHGEQLRRSGDQTSKELRAKTLVCSLATPGRHSVRANAPGPRLQLQGHGHGRDQVAGPLFDGPG
jgi:hypothetical protein